jgi:hypothetical protein
VIPIWGTAAVLIAPPAALFLNGYAPGNSLAAQHYDYVWHSITSEIDNVLSAASITPNGAVNNQLITAIQALIAVVASDTQFGVVKVDNTTIKATAGVLSTFNGVVPAPLPQTEAGVGKFVFIDSGMSNALVLPAGGTWAYYYNGITNGTYLAVIGGGGIAAGGSVARAGVGNYEWFGFAWRIA